MEEYTLNDWYINQIYLSYKLFSFIFGKFRFVRLAYTRSNETSFKGSDFDHVHHNEER